MKCFLTKIEIDYKSAFKAGLCDSYAWHQKVWQAFPNDGLAKRDFLTRLDEIDAGFRLLVLSQTEPVKPEWCPSDGWNSKSVPPGFFEHTSFRFSLVANPTRKVRSNAKGVVLKNSRRLAITKREELLAWLERKAAQGGFTIPELNQVQTHARVPQTFVKNVSIGKHFVTEFQGILHVTDQTTFKNAAITGIGSAKAFGFGMLCLSPLELP